jgi:hypothetical protein
MLSSYITQRDTGGRMPPALWRPALGSGESHARNLRFFVARSTLYGETRERSIGISGSAFLLETGDRPFDISRRPGGCTPKRPAAPAHHHLF